MRLVANKRTLARNVLLNWVALIAEVAVAFFLTPFIVHSLGLVVYGIWSLLNSVIGYLGLVDLGVRGSVGRFLNGYIARGERRQVKEVISTSLAFLSAMSLLAFVAALFTSENFILLFSRTPTDLLREIRLALPLMAVGLWIAFCGAVYRTVLAAYDRFDVINVIGIVGLTFRALSTVIVLHLGWGLLGLVGSSLAVGLLVNVAFALIARRIVDEVAFSFSAVSKARFDEMWRFGLATFTGRTAATLAVQTAPVIAMTFIGPAAVGMYGIAAQITQVCQKVIEQLGTVVYPSVMKLGGVEDLPGLKSVLNWYARVAMLIGVLLYVGVIVFARPFLQLWVGNDFGPAVHVVEMLSAGELLALVGGTSGLTLYALGRLKPILSIALLEGTSIVLLSALFTGPLGLGLPGLALGAVLPGIGARALAYPIMACRAVHESYLRYVTALGVRAGAAALLCFAVFTAIRSSMEPSTWLSFMLATSVAALAYLVVAAPLLLTRDERAKGWNYLCGRVGILQPLLNTGRRRSTRTGK